MSSVYDEVYAIVCRIPKGRVLTYGLISNLLNGRLSAQGVGWAMQALAKNPNKPGKYNATNVPWHRVINSQGRLSTHKNPDIAPGLQKKLLQAEGIKFDAEDKMDLPAYLWKQGLLE